MRKIFKPSLFWNFTQRRLALTDVLGQTVVSIFKGEAVQEGPETLVTTNLRCITSYKKEGLVYANMAEA